MVLSLVCLIPSQGWAQCRDTQDWTAKWTSCEVSASPNAARGQHHWLMYDLGKTYGLATLHLWNANEANLLNRGIKRAWLDYSADGQTWQEWGEIQVPQANGKSYYSGAPIAEFDQLEARYVLLTITENWGDPLCTSFHELSFEISKYPLPEDQELWIYPNPTEAVVNIAFESSEPQAYFIRVLNLMGQTVIEQSWSGVEGRNDRAVQVGFLPRGIYLVYVLDGDRQPVGTQKLVIR